MSRSGQDLTAAHDLAEADCQRNAAELARIRGWLERKGHPVQGRKYIHALEELVAPAREPTLDPGWPRIERTEP